MMGSTESKAVVRPRVGAMTMAMGALNQLRGQRALRVARVLDGRISEEQLVQGKLVVGASEKADLVIAGLRPELLFVQRGDQWALRVLPSMRGKLSDERGARRIEGHEGEILLGPDARGKVVIGGATLLFQLVLPPPTMPRPQLPASVRTGLLGQIDWRFTSIATTTFLGVFAVLVVLENADWAMPMSPVARVDRVLIQYDEPEPPPQPAAVWAQQDPLQHEAEPEPEPEPETVQSPPDQVAQAPTPSPRPAPSWSDEQTAQLIDDVQLALNETLGTLAQGDGALQDFLAPGAPTNNAEDVFAHVQGVTSQARSDQLAVRDVSGSGVTQPGIAGLVRRPTAGPVNTSSGLSETNPGRVTFRPDDFEPYDPGDFDDALVLRRVRAKTRAIQRCYEHELTRAAPGLQGRVTMEMRIMPAGNVRSQAVNNNTGSDALASCIARTLNGIRFSSGPAHPVEYSFPFVFAPQR